MKTKTVPLKIRGIGLMIAVALHENTPGGARGICESLQEKGILCKETHTWNKSTGKGMSGILYQRANFLFS